VQHTKPLLRAGGLNNFNHTRAKRLNGRNVVREDTHVTGRGGEVDLCHVGGAEDGLEKHMVTKQGVATSKEVRERERVSLGSAYA
jgi:hypothetical protein